MGTEKTEGRDTSAKGAAERVYLGIMRDLEQRRMAPGQRLVETDLARRYGVGRNAVREAIQRLAGRGIVDLSPNRSPAIRRLDAAETNEILDVASVMTELVSRTAAREFVAAAHACLLQTAVEPLSSLAPTVDLTAFGRARRGFYRALLVIGGNRELQRLFQNIGMHIIYSQFQSYDLLVTRVTDYQQIADAVAAKDEARAEKAARDHVEHVRTFINQAGYFEAESS
jgi:DNA-binding GntR family transcriptional regulator